MAKWTCQDAKWEKQPDLGSDEVLRGTLVSDCKVSEGQADSIQGILSLQNYLLGRISKLGKVHEGPVSETFEKLPSVRYDLTEDHSTDQYKVLIRTDIHIASDQKSHLIYANLSKQIEAEGDAKYLKKLDSSFDISPESDAGTYKIKLHGTMHIQKPWYAPSGIFKKEATKHMKEEFEKDRGVTLKDLSEHL